jgi:hypothetical protein
MLERSFLGCKSGSRAWYPSRELVLALKRGDIYRDGGRESFESYESYKKTERVMDEEGRRTMEEVYKGSATNFASICLGTSHSLHIK